MRFLILTLAILGCGGSAPGTSLDAPASFDAAVDTQVFDPGPEPTTPIEPVAGELTIEQLDLPAGLTFKLGESAIVVGPDGTIVLLDVGNTSHADDIRDAIRHLNTDVLTPAHGFAPRAPLQVEWIVITHFHADHIGGLPDLLTGSSALQVVHGVIHRGYTDVGNAMNPDAYAAACSLLRGSLAGLDRPLCQAAELAPCDPGQWTGSYPAIACEGLLAGDLTTTSDDAARGPSFLPLGEGARLVLIGADGFVSDGVALRDAPAWGHEQNGQENARSVIGMIEYGPFRYHFAGDLTGRGDVESPDLESHLVTAGAVWYGPRGVDIAHAHHHVRSTSSNATFADAVAPHDGRARNITGGINPAYLGSPAQDVLGRFGDGDRLGTGRIWVPRAAAGGGAHPDLVTADGKVIVQTVQHGLGYRVQAAGDALMSHAFESVRALP